MKKILFCLTVMCLLLLALSAALAEPGLSAAFEGAQPTTQNGPGERSEGGDSANPPGETPEATSAPVLAPKPALFGEGVRDITCAAYGNRVDYAQIGRWIVSRGYLVERERYCLIGQAPDGRRMALTDVLPSSFVPAGDALIYYGKDADGKYHWVMLEPGAEKPKRLDLSISDEVFYADADYVWYYTHIGEEISVRTRANKGGARNGIARVKGYPLVVMESGGVLVTNFDENQVEIWKDGKATVIYRSEDPILSVSSVGGSVWVEHEYGFGPVVDGALSMLLPGHIVRMTGTTDQFVLLLSFAGLDTYDVVLFNDRYGAWARVGSVRASQDAFVELHPNRKITVWGPEESLIFDIPPVEGWLAYGDSDVG